MARQWLLVLLTTLGLWISGAAFEIALGASTYDAVATWAAIGLTAGLFVGAINELGRNTVTSLTSLGKHRGYQVLGAAPELAAQTLASLPPDNRSAIGCLAFQPASAFATAFRDLQDALSKSKRVAFIGATPSEGATLAALCTAASATQQGRSVIVLDCDLRRRGLTRALETETDGGVWEACERPQEWRRFAYQEAETGLVFIPAAPAASAWQSLTNARGFSELLDQLEREFDLVVLDCPPALTSADGAILARRVNLCVLVATWDRTRLSTLRAAMRRVRPQKRPETAVYVNRVPPGYRFGRLRPD